MYWKYALHRRLVFNFVFFLSLKIVKLAFHWRWIFAFVSSWHVASAWWRYLNMASLKSISLTYNFCDFLMSLRSKHIVGDTPRAATSLSFRLLASSLKSLSHLQFCDLLNKWVWKVNSCRGFSQSSYFHFLFGCWLPWRASITYNFCEIACV